MNKHLIIATAIALASGPAWAQATNQTGNSAIKDSAPKVTASATEGANSFTEDQARGRFAKAGYKVTALTKDDKGIWTGTATKGGKTMKVGLDFKGNITKR